MPALVSVRLLQGLLGTAYGVLAVVVAIGSLEPATLVVVAGVVVASYLTARTIPPALVPLGQVPRLCAVALIVICMGVIAEAVAGPRASEWIAIVMAYCSGNRFRAAGIGPAR